MAIHRLVTAAIATGRAVWAVIERRRMFVLAAIATGRVVWAAIKRRRRLAIALAVAVIAVGVSGGLWLSQPSPSQSEHFGYQISGVRIAHAAIGDDKGCAVCHAEAITYTTCSDAGCHAPLSAPFQITPTTRLINFPHHNTANIVGAPSDCQTCHAGAANDARFVTIPTASHTGLCATCHGRTHS